MIQGIDGVCCKCFVEVHVLKVRSDYVYLLVVQIHWWESRSNHIYKRRQPVSNLFEGSSMNSSVPKPLGRGKVVSTRLYSIDI